MKQNQVLFNYDVTLLFFGAGHEQIKVQPQIWTFL